MHTGTKSGFEEMKPLAYYQYELDNVGNRIGVSEILRVTAATFAMLMTVFTA
ncbi:MAG: hypothetical protein M5U34_26905 [Chloroflexi bacterium]|nr:hypothetical protein [Chloroflexota bacterium]